MSDDSVWDTLGIPPTRDSGAIRKAYAMRLRAIKRDLDPREFEKLRAAYEQALSQCGDPSITPVARIVVPPPTSSAFTDDCASPVNIVRTPPLRRERTRARDHGESGSGPIPPRDPTERSTPPRRNDRERVGEALAGLREAVDAGRKADIHDRFAAAHDALSHPITGVSVAAFAGFERAIVDMIEELITARVEFGDLARAASARFRWSERLHDVRGDLDPLSGVLGGFTLAEEIARCARGEAGHRSPVAPEFARELAGPVDPSAFAKRIGTRDLHEARRAEWAQLEAMESMPLAWLPAANVDWWRRALGTHRVFRNEVAIAFAAVSLATIPLGFALLGLRDAFVIVCFVVLVFGRMAINATVARQEARPVAFLEPIFARLGAIGTFVARGPRKLLILVMGPLILGMTLAGVIEGLQKPQVPLKAPLELGRDVLLWGLIGLVPAAIAAFDSERARIFAAWFAALNALPLSAGAVTYMKGAGAADAALAVVGFAIPIYVVAAIALAVSAAGRWLRGRRGR